MTPLDFCKHIDKAGFDFDQCQTNVEIYSKELISERYCSYGQAEIDKDPDSINYYPGDQFDDEKLKRAKCLSEQTF